MKLTKPAIAVHIEDKKWELLTKREKAYIILLYKRKYTVSQLIDLLFYNSEVWFYKMRKRVQDKIKND